MSKVLTVSLGLLFLAGTLTTAEAEDPPGFSAGFWTFMEKPGASPAEIESSCQFNFSEVKADRSAETFSVIDPAAADVSAGKKRRLKLLFRESCPPVVSGRVICTGTDFGGDAPKKTVTSYAFRKNGGSTAMIIDPDNGPEVMVYPERCPEAVINDLKATGAGP